MSNIGEDIEIGTRTLDAGLSNIGRVNTSNTEDNIPGEGKVFFDIRFTAYHKEMEMKFLINLEAQRSSDPGKLGYHLENRIIFYLARMISAQKQTEFYHSDYDNLKRVRSIWLCLDNNEDGDSVEEINLNTNIVFGNRKKQYNIDLMRVIIINIRSGENARDSQNILISMLEKLFSGMEAEEKKQILTEKYGMVMTDKLERRMRIMCNLSEDIFERGMERGIEKGIDQHLEKQIQIKVSKGKTVSQIAEELEETEEQIEALIERMQHSLETEWK